MAISLNGFKVAILPVDGFEQAELVEPQRALREAGAQVHVVSQKPRPDSGFRACRQGRQGRCRRHPRAANAADYDALVLPGGVVNGDAIRLDAKAQSLVKEADEAKKTIAVICHDGWLPISAGIVAGRTMTSWPSLQDDVRNAGGNLGRSGSADQRQFHHEPQARRSSRVQPGADRGAGQSARCLSRASCAGRNRSLADETRVRPHDLAHARRGAHGRGVRLVPAFCARRARADRNRVGAEHAIAAALDGRSGVSSGRGPGRCHRNRGEKLALTRAGDPQVREFAERMIVDHTKLARNLDVIAKRHGITAPPATDSSLIGSLENLQGADFDRA